MQIKLLKIMNFIAALREDCLPPTAEEALLGDFLAVMLGVLAMQRRWLDQGILQQFGLQSLYKFWTFVAKDTCK